MISFIRLFSAFLSIILATISGPVSASVVISGTRVIYPSDAKEVSVKLVNKGKRPVLIQSWIDDGDDQAKPEEIHVPFLLTPPINRVEPEKGQTLRISYLGGSLPNDRETVYWLNVLEIPAKNPLLKDKNLLQMAFRSRIKLFYRPADLKGNANEAASALVWKRTGQQLQVINPTPYYISLTSITLNEKKNSVDMVAPFSDKNFNIAAKASDKITVKYINDYGAVSRLEATVN